MVIEALLAAIPMFLIKEEFTDHILEIFPGSTIYKVYKFVEEGKEGAKIIVYADPEGSVPSVLLVYSEPDLLSVSFGFWY